MYLAALSAESTLTLGCPGILGTLAVGGTVVLLDDPAPEAAFHTIAREGVTVTTVTPGIAARWLDALDGAEADLASLRVMQIGGGASRPAPALAARIEPGFGCRLQQVWGRAEGLLTATRLDDPRDVVQAPPISDRQLCTTLRTHSCCSGERRAGWRGTNLPIPSR